VTITGPANLEPDASGVYTLTITGGPAVDGGLDVSTSGGTLTASGANTKLLNGEITHQSPGTFSGGTLSFTFTLTAPSSAGQVTLYGVGLSSNGSGSSGDGTGKTTFAVTVAAATAPHIVVTDQVAPTGDLQMAFGTVTNGLNSSLTVTVGNSGDANLVIGTLGSTNPLASPFSIQTDNCSGKTIAPAGTCSIIVKFAPTSATPFTDSFNIPSNDQATPSVTFSVSGTGAAAPTPKIGVTDTVPPANDLQIPFGTVLEGGNISQTVTIANSGSADLVIGTLAGGNPLAAPFSITTDNCSGKTVAPAGSCTVTVKFAPTGVGVFSDSFDIPSNDPSTPSITFNVSGTGSSTNVPQVTVTDPVAPTSDHALPFGMVQNGLFSTQTVTVGNSGNADLVLGTLASVNPLAAPFTITADNCSGKTIAPAGSCTVTVKFAPTSAGGVSDSFDIPSNDPSTPNITLSVSGSGNDAPTAPELISPADGQTGVGTPATLVWKPSTDPDGDAVSYHVYYCTDSTFVSCAPVNVAMRKKAGIFLAFSGLMFAGMVVRKGARGKAVLLVIMATLLLSVGVIISACGSGNETSTPAPEANTDMTYEASGLATGSTYYWKVVADDGKGGLATSPTWTFKTQ
jgi:hypothetical protein